MTLKNAKWVRHIYFGASIIWLIAVLYAFGTIIPYLMKLGFQAFFHYKYLFVFLNFLLVTMFLLIPLYYAYVRGNCFAAKFRYYCILLLSVPYFLGLCIEILTQFILVMHIKVVLVDSVGIVGRIFWLWLSYKFYQAVIYTEGRKNASIERLQSERLA